MNYLYFKFYLIWASKIHFSALESINILIDDVVIPKEVLPEKYDCMKILVDTFNHIRNGNV